MVFTSTTGFSGAQKMKRAREEKAAANRSSV
jgi:hypothetical protein